MHRLLTLLFTRGSVTAGGQAARDPLSNELCPPVVSPPCLPGPWEMGSCEAVIVSRMRWEERRRWILPRIRSLRPSPGWKTIGGCRPAAHVPLISQMKAAGISYGVEIAYRSISKYSC